MDIEFDKEKFDRYKYAVSLSVITGLSLILAFFLLIMPLYRTANAKSTEQAVVHKKLVSLQDRKKVLDSLKSQEQELEKASSLLSTALPETKDVGPLFIQLNQLIIDTGGVIKGISGDNSPVAAPSQSSSSLTNLNKYVYSLPISFSSYVSLKSFIDQSKQALRLIDITSISATASESGKIDATVSITTYARSN